MGRRSGEADRWVVGLDYLISLTNIFLQVLLDGEKDNYDKKSDGDNVLFFNL